MVTIGQLTTLSANKDAAWDAFFEAFRTTGLPAPIADAIGKALLAYVNTEVALAIALAGPRDNAG